MCWRHYGRDGCRQRPEISPITKALNLLSTLEASLQCCGPEEQTHNRNAGPKKIPWTGSNGLGRPTKITAPDPFSLGTRKGSSLGLRLQEPVKGSLVLGCLPCPDLHELAWKTSAFRAGTQTMSIDATLQDPAVRRPMVDAVSRAAPAVEPFRYGIWMTVVAKPLRQFFGNCWIPRSQVNLAGIAL